MAKPRTDKDLLDFLEDKRVQSGWRLEILATGVELFDTSSEPYGKTIREEIMAAMERDKR